MGWLGWILAGTAWAGVSPAREPLSARPIERPAVLPKGWTELGFMGGLDRAATGIRYGLGAQVDLGLGQAWSADGLGSVRMSVRRSLFEREPPMTSIALELGWTEPVAGAARSAPDAGLVIRQELAPFQLEVAGSWIQPLTGRGHPAGRAALTMEGGPLLVIGSLAVERRWRPGLDVALQLSRGLMVGGGAAWTDGEGARGRALLGVWL